MAYTQEQLDEIAGEQNTIPRVEIPRLVFDGAMGVMGINRGVNDAEGIDEKDLPLQAVILSVRVSYKKFEKDAKGKMKAIYYTNEGKSSEAEFTLKKLENRVKSVVDNGTGKFLQDSYSLKQTSVLYLLLSSAGEVVKLEVQGKSAGNLFQYYKEFAEGEHKRDFVCLVGVQEESFEDKKTGKTVTYYSLTFKKGKAVAKTAVNSITEKIIELGSGFAEMDAKQVSKPEMKPMPESEAEEEAEIVDDEEDTEDISPADIPF